MNLDLTEEQELLRKSMREFSQDEIKLLARDKEENNRFQQEIL